MQNEFPYEKQVSAEVVDMDSGKLEKLILSFDKLQQSGEFPGGQIAIRRHGHLVINHACGIARGYRREEGIVPEEVRTDSYFPAHSCGKPLASLAIAMLEERNLLSLDTPLIELLPELGKHNRDDITLEHVLTHTAGMVFPGLFDMFSEYADHETIWQYMVNNPPHYKPGTFAYMPTEYGWLLSKICQRVDGRSIVQFIHDEIAGPLQLHRLRYGLAGRDINKFVYQYWLGKNKVILAGANVADIFEEMVNSEPYYESLNPAISLVCDAASLAGFYEFLVNKGITHKGVRLIKKETLDKYTRKRFFRFNRSYNAYSSMGRGFMTGTKYVPSMFGWYGTDKCFGHGGAFSSVAFADLKTGLSVVILTNGNRGVYDMSTRLIPLCHAIRMACHKKSYHHARTDRADAHFDS